jgi:hypothetical protein
LRLKRFGLADHRPELGAGLAHGALVQGSPAGVMGFLHVAALCNSLTNAGAGAVELANAVVALCEQPNQFQFVYPESAKLWEKAQTVAQKIYGAQVI